MSVHQREAQEKSHEYERTQKEDCIQRLIVNHVHKEQDDQRRFDGCNEERKNQLKIAQIESGLVYGQYGQENQREEYRQQLPDGHWVRKPMMIAVAMSVCLVVNCVVRHSVWTSKNSILGEQYC